jgi:hypothetical protein
MCNSQADSASSILVTRSTDKGPGHRNVSRTWAFVVLTPISVACPYVPIRIRVPLHAPGLAGVGRRRLGVARLLDQPAERIGDLRVKAGAAMVLVSAPAYSEPSHSYSRS